MNRINHFLCLTAGTIFAATLASAQIPINLAPTRVVGHRQVNLVTASPNLVEGKDLMSPAAVAIDGSASPPILYVADQGNNRVLGWRDARGFQNGAPADIVIGQRDLYSTVQGGPGTQLATAGLASPVALAVDASGNLYVADAGNNRILRFPKPFEQTDDLKIPNMVIGQATFNANIPNANSPNPTDKTIALNLGAGRLYRCGLTIDAAGNLWFSDAGNNRVLRYPAAALQRGANQPAADLVLGQTGFTTNVTNLQVDRRNKALMTSPSGLAFDAAGRLYVCDGASRVMVYARPATGASADRILGVLVLAQGAPPVTEVNETTLGRLVNGRLSPPEGVFTVGNTVFVIDTPSHRIVRYDSYDTWAPEATEFSPKIKASTGQQDTTTGRINRGQSEPSNNSFSTPVSAAVFQNEVYITDNGNNRVVVCPVQSNGIAQATRVLGQSDFSLEAPNSIDGREFFLFSGFQSVGSGAISDGTGVVVDSTSDTPRLYVADTYNNRILGFADARNVRPGDRADIVIGQKDFNRILINSPSNDVNQVLDGGLFWPSNVAVDANGNLYVADSGNARVLRFPRPFQQSGGAIRPDLVLGQSSLFTKVTDATARTMARPFGMAFTAEGHLLVADGFNNRVLFFRRPQGGDFANGQAADKVFGQPDFSSQQGSNLPNRMVSPHGIAIDGDDRLYVCDAGNNRVLIFDRVSSADVDVSAALVIPGFRSPHSVFVNKDSGEIWVTDTGANRTLRFPRYIDLLLFGDIRANYEIPGFAPLAVTQDGLGGLVIADAANRIAFYYAAMYAYNGGNQLRRFAPAGYVALKPVEGVRFGDTTMAPADVSPPLPTSVADLQVTVNDVLVPIRSVSPAQVDFLIPSATSAAQNVSVVLSKRSTGQVIGASVIPISAYAPAFLTPNGPGGGQILASNAGGTQNSAGDRAGRSETISVFATGFGPVPGMPEDGVATSEKTPVRGDLRVVLGTDFVPADNILYAGLAPGMVGVIQIDIKIPDKTPPDPNVPIVLLYNSVPSNQDGLGGRVITTIAVKP